MGAEGIGKGRTPRNPSVLGAGLGSEDGLKKLEALASLMNRVGITYLRQGDFELNVTTTPRLDPQALEALEKLQAAAAVSDEEILFDEMAGLKPKAEGGHVK